MDEKDIRLIEYHDDRVMRGCVMVYKYDTDEKDFDKVMKVISDWAISQGFVPFGKPAGLHDKPVKSVKPVEDGYEISIFRFFGGTEEA